MTLLRDGSTPQRTGSILSAGLVIGTELRSAASAGEVLHYSPLLDCVIINTPHKIHIVRSVCSEIAG